MGYIGNEPTTGHFPVQTNLVGPGPTYTLDRAPASAGAIEVSVAGVLQPTTSYSVSGTTLTMAGVASSIPIFIRYLGETLTLPTIADGVVVEDKIGAGAVTASKLGAGAVTLAKLGADAVDGTKIADNAINSEHYTDGSIDNIHTNFQPGTTFKGDGSSARGKITLNCEMNTHGVSIQSPAHSSAASYTLTLPPNDGAADEFLKTDGSGVLSFATAGGTNGWHLLQSTVLTNQTSVDITGLDNSTYGMFVVVMIGAETGSSAGQFGLRMGDAASGFRTSGYFWGVLRHTCNGTNVDAQNSTSASYIKMNRLDSQRRSSAVIFVNCGQYHVGSPYGRATCSGTYVQDDTTATLGGSIIGGTNQNGLDLDRLSVMTDATSFAKGRISFYGIAQS
jgi:hypothetical protein